MSEHDPPTPAQRISLAARLTLVALLAYLQMLITEAARGAPDAVIEGLRPWIVPDLTSARRALAGVSWTLWALIWLTLAVAALELIRAARHALADRALPWR
jgi:hypothetical protein